MERWLSVFPDHDDDYHESVGGYLAYALLAPTRRIKSIWQTETLLGTTIRG
jgi:hypothetical protein